MKWLVMMPAIIVLVLTAIFGFSTSKAMAFDAPNQDDTANATDVIIWHGDNLTLNQVSGNFSITLTVPELDTILQDKTDDIVNEIDAKFEASLILLFIFALTAFGYWHRDRLLIAISGFAWLVYAFTLWGVSEWLSITTGIAGFYFVVKAFWDDRKGKV
jgi:hypothetical protein